MAEEKDERMPCASPINENKLPEMKFESEQLPAHQPREERRLRLFHFRVYSQVHYFFVIGSYHR